MSLGGVWATNRHETITRHYYHFNSGAIRSCALQQDGAGRHTLEISGCVFQGDQV